MLDSSGRPVRTLVRDRREQPGRVSYTWDGRDNAERVVAEGVYRPRVRLDEHGRTIVLPNPIRVDTTAPTITLLRVFPRVFSPDGDGRDDRVTAEYEIDEPARAMMLVDGERRVLSKFRATEGRLVWFGLVDGRSVRPGTYEIRLRAFDRAGNRSARTRAVPVRVRYVAFARDTVEAVAGRRFGIGVSTDAVSYRWLFDGRKGTARRPRLVLRAPEEPGTYVLYVASGRFADGPRSTCRLPRSSDGPPVLVLGVRRSGTTLLRVILDRSPGIAIPDESHFVPQLAHRHSTPVDVDAFVDDLGRLQTLRRWGITVDEVASASAPGDDGGRGDRCGVLGLRSAPRQVALG